MSRVERLETSIQRNEECEDTRAATGLIISVHLDEPIDGYKLYRFGAFIPDMWLDSIQSGEKKPSEIAEMLTYQAIGSFRNIWTNWDAPGTPLRAEVPSGQIAKLIADFVDETLNAYLPV